MDQTTRCSRPRASGAAVLSAEADAPSSGLQKRSHVPEPPKPWPPFQFAKPKLTGKPKPKSTVHDRTGQHRALAAKAPIDSRDAGPKGCEAGKAGRAVNTRGAAVLPRAALHATRKELVSTKKRWNAAAGPALGELSWPGPPVANNTAAGTPHDSCKRMRCETATSPRSPAAGFPAAGQAAATMAFMARGAGQLSGCLLGAGGDGVINDSAKPLNNQGPTAGAAAQGGSRGRCTSAAGVTGIQDAEVTDVFQPAFADRRCLSLLVDWPAAAPGAGAHAGAGAQPMAGGGGGGGCKVTGGPLLARLSPGGREALVARSPHGPAGAGVARRSSSVVHPLLAEVDVGEVDQHMFIHRPKSLPFWHTLLEQADGRGGGGGGVGLLIPDHNTLVEEPGPGPTGNAGPSTYFNRVSQLLDRPRDEPSAPQPDQEQPSIQASAPAAGRTRSTISRLQPASFLRRLGLCNVDAVSYHRIKRAARPIAARLSGASHTKTSYQVLLKRYSRVLQLPPDIDAAADAPGIHAASTPAAGTPTAGTPAGQAANPSSSLSAQAAAARARRVATLQHPLHDWLQLPLGAAGACDAVLEAVQRLLPDMPERELFTVLASLQLRCEARPGGTVPVLLLLLPVEAVQLGMAPAAAAVGSAGAGGSGAGGDTASAGGTAMDQAAGATAAASQQQVPAAASLERLAFVLRHLRLWQSRDMVQHVLVSPAASWQAMGMRMGLLAPFVVMSRQASAKSPGCVETEPPLQLLNPEAAMREAGFAAEQAARWPHHLRVQLEDGAATTYADWCALPPRTSTAVWVPEMPPQTHSTNGSGSGRPMDDLPPEPATDGNQPRHGSGLARRVGGDATRARIMQVQEYECAEWSDEEPQKRSREESDQAEPEADTSGPGARAKQVARSQSGRERGQKGRCHGVPMAGEQAPGPAPEADTAGEAGAAVAGPAGPASATPGAPGGRRRGGGGPDDAGGAGSDGGHSSRCSSPVPPRFNPPATLPVHAVLGSTWAERLWRELERLGQDAELGGPHKPVVIRAGGDPAAGARVLYALAYCPKGMMYTAGSKKLCKCSMRVLSLVDGNGELVAGDGRQAAEGGSLTVQDTGPSMWFDKTMITKLGTWSDMLDVATEAGSWMSFNAWRGRSSSGPSRR